MQDAHDDTTLKRCSKCNVDKPFVDFHKNKRGKYGLKSWCKVCSSLANAEWIASPGVKEAARERKAVRDAESPTIAYDAATIKRCYKCKTEKPLTDFYRGTNHKYGV